MMNLMIIIKAYTIKIVNLNPKRMKKKHKSIERQKNHKSQVFMPKHTDKEKNNKPKSWNNKTFI